MLPNKKKYHQPFLSFPVQLFSHPGLTVHKQCSFIFNISEKCICIMIHAGIVGQVRIYLQHAHYEFIKSPLNLKGMLYLIVYSEGKSVSVFVAYDSFLVPKL